MSLWTLLAESPALFVTLCFVLGLMIGSFLNVLIWRLPQMLNRQWRQQCAELAAEDAGAHTPTVVAAAPGVSSAGDTLNLLRPRSFCPGCRSPIKAWHNVPVLSWLALRGRCASCGARIAARYPLVELLTALLSAAVASRFGFGWPALGALAITWVLIAATFIDHDTQLLPDSLTLPLLWLGLLGSLFASGSQDTMGNAATAGVSGAFPADTRSAILGAAFGYLSLWSVYHLFRLLTGKEGMGYGDFKLLAALGACMGWQMVLPIVLLSSAVGALVGGALLLTGRLKRGMHMPFGPYLAAAGWIALLWGPSLVARYLAHFSGHG